MSTQGEEEIPQGLIENHRHGTAFEYQQEPPYLPPEEEA